MLLAVEATPQSEAVISAGARLARRIGAEVIVLSVRERAYTRGLTWDVRPAGEIAELISHALHQMQRLGLRASGIVAAARMGTVAREIVYAALKYRADEIVIGSSGRSLIGAFVGSSVAPAVVRLSPVPVIAVPTGPGRQVKQTPANQPLAWLDTAPPKR
jgi:nucleotide-binding universal stress UspA family protein